MPRSDAAYRTTSPCEAGSSSHKFIMRDARGFAIAHDSELTDIAGISVSEVVDGKTFAEPRAERLPNRDLERVF